MNDATKILLTGFEPFGGEGLNPSWEIARYLNGETLSGHVVHARRLSCVFGQALQELERHIDELQPSLVLALGQAGGRSELSLERVAINVDDARIADNAGGRPVDEPVVAGGPAAYFTTLPIKAMAAGLRAAGLPAGVSQSAGTFVCNHVFYGLQHLLRQQPLVRSGFMHVPYLPEQSARLPATPAGAPPSLGLTAMIDGVRLALQLALATGEDLRESAGTIA
ncbi:pyroglutamyl-peptidase I [Pelomonas sp. KK5]|uniref:pyroglutamyl-peptidase I n=1 Tax=Pelomonas sp. KK5 TaxID=1855730 RepID=UPI00097CA48D|nr:pyroglutamyl-peptidase I [Pelomonas sp. KK5]